MKKVHFLILSCFTFCSAIYLTSFTPASDTVSTYPHLQIRESYLRGVDFFVVKLEVMDLAAASFTGDEESIRALQRAHEDSRKAYKKIEYLASYLEEEFVNDYINGAPLPKLERNSPQLSVLQPQGLQVLEELIYGEKPDREEIKLLTEKLLVKAQALRKFEPAYALTDRVVFEAIRVNLIRITSLGITGFDTPVRSEAALQEALISLESSFDAFKLYLPLVRSQKPDLAATLETNFENAINYLQEHKTDFEAFDRLYFISNYLDPLFGEIKTAHYTLGIETWKETDSRFTKRSLNYDAEHIFTEELLNPYYFMQLEPSGYNQKVVELGRYLFFDPVLSAGNDRACASCHSPEIGFTDGLPKSTATGGEGTVSRNAPTLINAVFSDRYFYDLRTDVLENQITHVITDRHEFHTTYLQIFKKLKQSPEYLTMFREAFPSLKNDPIQKYTLATAIAAYIKSLSSFNSAVDLYVRGETDQLDESVKNGFNLFMGKAGCGTCHFAPVFNGSVPPLFRESESEVLGVPAHPDLNNPVADSDPGRAEGVLKERTDIYRNSFKTTTVRNIRLTAPYMHNGVFATLEEVIDFYDRGGGAGLGLEVPNQTLPAEALNLSEEEKKNVIAFMKALTDTTGMNVKPKRLPEFPEALTNNRKIGGEY